MADEFMIAGNIQQARATAEVDLGWRTCAKGWLKPDGTVVRYIYEPYQLRGLPTGTVIHVGHGFYRRRAKEIEEFMAIIKPRFTVRSHDTSLKD